MKKICLVALALLAVIITVICVNASPAPAARAENDYLRIHVRADSNSEQAQRVKYEVKDEVVRFITPYVAQCVTKQAAIEAMKDILPQIEQVCDAALRERGYSYGAKASVRSENFPTRVYGDLTLESGVYDALIIELGSGKGDNWWCVIYPPLCFTSASNNVEYRSVIYDIITKFFSKN